MAHNHELEWRGVDEAVLLHFDAKDRPRAVGKSAVETPFAEELSNYEVLGGVRVPTRAEVRWDLPEGPFVYFRVKITDLELG